MLVFTYCPDWFDTNGSYGIPKFSHYYVNSNYTIWYNIEMDAIMVDNYHPQPEKSRDLP